MKTQAQEIEEYNEWQRVRKTINNGQWTLSRTDIINHFITKNNYVNYLEIGVNNGANIRKINIAHKDGVDPGIETINPPEVNYPITSDAFFDLIRGHDIKYDIIFIDGLHHDYQVYKDIKNALNHLQPNGTIICHDMNPRWSILQNKHSVVGAWNGDCWKAWMQLRSELKDYYMTVVDTDHGCGIIHKGAQELITLPCTYTELTFDYLDSNRKDLLNLITVEEFKLKYD